MADGVWRVTAEPTTRHPPHAAPPRHRVRHCDAGPVARRAHRRGVRTAHAARLLAAVADAPRDALLALARAAGCDGACVPLARADRRALALLDAPLEHPQLARGPGARRALVATVPTATPLRDALRLTAARLAAHAPWHRWLLVLAHADGSACAVAAADLPPAPGRPPRLAALLCDPRRVRPSDAETLAALAATADGDAPGADLLAHARALEVLGRDALGRKFYHQLERTVAALADGLTGVADAQARADLALLCATRTLFLAFLEAKGWLDDDRAFLARRYDACMAAGGRFDARVLCPLWFGTLNTPPRRRAPTARAFGRVPFLNGGLFAPTPLERRHRAHRHDDAALGLLLHDLLGRYRFTAREDATTLSEAAVDPEMLGRAFESLMAARDRKGTGAFYTPPALVAHVGDAALRAALAGGPVSEDDVAAALLGHAHPDRTVRETLAARAATLRVCDPACGSGAFLVHALERLAALRRTCGDPRPVADVRRDVLARSIFGVDVNPTAVWLAELRLWLSVVIECEVDDPRHAPPLPNLDHHVRVGDALAAPAGLAHLAHDGWGGAPWGAPGTAARSASALATLRARYATLSGARKLAAARRLDAHERAQALATLDRALARLRADRADRLAALRAPDLFGRRSAPHGAARARLATLRDATRELAARRRTLARGGALPFGFPWHFADAAAAGGFDLVVGNPPWVRPHAVPPAERLALRARYECARHAAWTDGVGRAGTGFGGQADLAALFTERAVALARPGGTVALLLPAKLWRTLAGGGLRTLLPRETRLHTLEDWSHAPAAFDAVTYPALLLATRREPQHHRASDPPVRVTVHVGRRASTTHVPLADVALADARGAPWLLLPADVRAALDALRAAGEPSDLLRPTLGAKCGLNAAYLVALAPDDDGASPLARVVTDGRTGLVERALLRPALRGEDLTPGPPRPARWLLWPHDDAGRPLARLPEHAAAWLAPHRAALAARADARAGRAPWWTCFRTGGASPRLPRLVWADLARAPSPRVLPAGDPHVPLNTCYVAPLPDATDAHALAALLAAPPIVALLGALAEPARGGYRRHLAWTVAMLPLPRDWARARLTLAPLAGADAATLTRAVCSAYHVDEATLAPLVAWDAALATPAGPARPLPPAVTPPAPLAAPTAPPRPVALRERPPAFATRRHRAR